METREIPYKRPNVKIKPTDIRIQATWKVSKFSQRINGAGKRRYNKGSYRITRKSCKGDGRGHGRRKMKW